MSAEVAFLLGLAAGGFLAFLVLVLAQAAGKKVPGFDVEDAVTEQAAKERTTIEQKRDAAHAAIDQLTPAEIDRVLNGAATVDDIMRERPTNVLPFAGGKPT